MSVRSTQSIVERIVLTNHALTRASPLLIAIVKNIRLGQCALFLVLQETDFVGSVFNGCFVERLLIN